MKKANGKKKNNWMNDFSFGRATALTVCVLFFLALVFIGICSLSRSATEEYAQVKVADAHVFSEQKLATARVELSRKAIIMIGEGVVMSDHCDVGRFGIYCY